MKGCLKWLGLMTAIAVGIVTALVIVIVSCSYVVSSGIDSYLQTRTAVARAAPPMSPPFAVTPVVP